MKIARRNFIAQSLMATAGITSTLQATAAPEKHSSPARPVPKADEAFKISIFSKNLQWLDYTAMAKTAAEIGFDGVDLTVRPLGHVLPENVETDLPKAVEAVQKAGLKVYMMTTAIGAADEPHTEKILKTASALGIRHYRMGWLSYDDKKTIDDDLKTKRDTLKALAQLNEKYGISGEYQNHSGTYFGAAIWDLQRVLAEVNSAWLGSQYDIMHASVEGFNAWSTGLKLIAPYIRSIDLKDFQWTKKDGKWASQTTPVGEGLIDFKKYFALLKRYGVRVPASLHYEYDLGGAENGGTTLTKPKEEVIAAMKKDLALFRKMIQEA
ncbi:sugar phosphate isomerase/epimerase family protein [Chryseolinea lacunae]|uniref:Sugar phosphate isomerase/epimerase n=1 Tax=Chryseolinea lacunae TaxID=2801331 RepID=A0ABS1L0R4_9BACT|nr:sugar phosphate isomerase/epimerase family protein [Chryseolinea lacunae]MBL0745286.1 sugar phosphate isomerase/epimerase [Chryseolinea lacunae]